MSKLTSSSWYRVASLKPRLHAHFEVHRQIERKQPVFVLQDHSTGKFYRFNESAYDIIGRMDGKQTVHDIWEASNACHGNAAPTQDEIITVLGRMHAIDALHMKTSADCLELLERVKKNKDRKKWYKTLFSNPLSVRVPLFDPEKLINIMMPVAGRLFSYAGLGIWLLVVLWATVTAFSHWPELSHGGADQILKPTNLLLMLVIYPVMKLFHEFGHAIATRKWGGEVHEMGITLLVFFPVPYVNASAMTIIESKYRRMAVAAAGMMVELFMAALALLVWINVEPGLVRLTAFNIILIGTVSTVLFNANPLLRFDSYYILKDALYIPNLSSRSSRYLLYLAKRYLFGLQHAASPAVHQREKFWFWTYGTASAIFRIGISVVIILFIAGNYFFLGVALAVWAAVLLVILPVFKAMRFVCFSQVLAENRLRAIGSGLGIVAITGAVIFLIPVPLTTQAQGVLWLPDDAQVQAGISGTVVEVIAAPSTNVIQGEPLVRLSDPLLEARIRLMEAELLELQVKHRIKHVKDQKDAISLEAQINSKQAELDREYERYDNLIIHSKNNGRFILNRAQDLPQRYVHKGEQLGFVLDEGEMTVRVAVQQDRIGLIRGSVESVEVKLADTLHASLPATLTRKIPAAQTRLPSSVLGTRGGGNIAVQPDDEQGLTPVNSVFLLDVTLKEEPETWRIGQRAYVKFDHGHQPLAGQWLRLGRQLFIRRFGV